MLSADRLRALLALRRAACADADRALRLARAHSADAAARVAAASLAVDGVDRAIIEAAAARTEVTAGALERAEPFRERLRRDRARARDQHTRALAALAAVGREVERDRAALEEALRQRKAVEAAVRQRDAVLARDRARREQTAVDELFQRRRPV